MAASHGREALLQLYKQLLRSAETFPSKNRLKIYQAIRDDWRDNKHIEGVKLQQQLSVAYKGLSQLRQFDETEMTGGQVDSTNWSVKLEQNPMPKPDDYDERKKKKK
ncbi:hypothetical protein MPSEU_000102300 [Mayamaea pseudoterrestris]|nr:hypothetical protein MPSEU_000102300 [Mayamaea pseudoterrestris]